MTGRVVDDVFEHLGADQAGGAGHSLEDQDDGDGPALFVEQSAQMAARGPARGHRQDPGLRHGGVGARWGHESPLVTSRR